jgi:membrane fusion protein (multidrug efflux system)
MATWRGWIASHPKHTGAIVGATLVLLLLIWWWIYRTTRSITEDAFVEANIVNVAPQAVSGRIVRYLVDENDVVTQGQLLAEIDPVPYRDQLELARAKLAAAEAELKRQETALARLRIEVPIQIEVAKRTLAAAGADHTRALDALRLTKDEVEHGIEEAKATLDATSADLVLAEQEYTRFTNLEKEKAAPLRKAQEVTQARDSAQARRRVAVTKLASARANQTQIAVATSAANAAEKSAEKAMKGVDLAETGNAQIREMELVTEVKKQAVNEAQRGVQAADDQLKYTQIRAPFPGVVVKRYRHLGDFASAGVSILSMYNPDLLYVTANLEETRLHGVAPGNPADLRIDAFAEPFRGRVVWINKSTGAQFALLPRNVVAGEFTKVVQRVPVRIAIEKDDRWPLLRSGLSVHVSISHGKGDPEWAAKAAKDMASIESRYNQPAE